MPVGVHRGELQAILLRALPAATGHTGRRMVALDQGSGSVRVRFEDGSTAAGRAVVGADGNRSAVRAATLGQRALRDCGYFGWRGTTAWPDGVAFVALAARGLAAGGNVEHPLGQRVRAWMTAAMPASVALAQFRAIVDSPPTFVTRDRHEHSRPLPSTEHPPGPGASFPTE